MPTEVEVRKPFGERFDDGFRAGRRTFLAAIVIAFTINAGYWLVTNGIWSSRNGHWWVEDTATASALALVLATIALAIAAYNQARAAVDLANVSVKQAEAATALTGAAGRQASTAWAELKIQTRPSLTIQFRAESARAGQSREVRSLSPMDLIEIGEEDRAIYLYNAGPGVAWDIKVSVTALGSTPASDGKSMQPAQRSSLLLGPGESTQITFPGPLMRELWPEVALVPKFAILFKATAESPLAGEEEGEGGESWEYVGIGGLIVEQVQREGLAGIQNAWRILTDSECNELDSRKTAPNAMPDVVGRSGPRLVKWLSAGSE